MWKRTRRICHKFNGKNKIYWNTKSIYLIVKHVGPADSITRSTTLNTAEVSVLPQQETQSYHIVSISRTRLPSILPHNFSYPTVTTTITSTVKPYNQYFTIFCKKQYQRSLSIFTEEAHTHTHTISFTAFTTHNIPSHFRPVNIIGLSILPWQKVTTTDTPRVVTLSVLPKQHTQAYHTGSITTTQKPRLRNS